MVASEKPILTISINRDTRDYMKDYLKSMRTDGTDLNIAYTLPRKKRSYYGAPSYLSKEDTTAAFGMRAHERWMCDISSRLVVDLARKDFDITMYDTTRSDEPAYITVRKQQYRQDLWWHACPHMGNLRSVEVLLGTDPTLDVFFGTRESMCFNRPYGSGGGGSTADPTLKMTLNKLHAEDDVVCTIRVATFDPQKIDEINSVKWPWWNFRNSDIGQALMLKNDFTVVDVSRANVSTMISLSHMATSWAAFLARNPQSRLAIVCAKSKGTVMDGKVPPDNIAMRRFLRDTSIRHEDKPSLRPPDIEQNDEPFSIEAHLRAHLDYQARSVGIEVLFPVRYPFDRKNDLDNRPTNGNLRRIQRQFTVVFIEDGSHWSIEQSQKLMPPTTKIFTRDQAAFVRHLESVEEAWIANGKEAWNGEETPLVTQ